MKCPFCNYLEDKVIDSRPVEDGTVVRRRRECVKCGGRFTTYEKVESMQLLVVKKDGTSQLFDKNKILGGMIKACEKRPVSISQLEGVVNYIERQLTSAMKKEVSTVEIGEMIMEQLKELDEVAYVRFASVYRQFKDIDTFMDELKRIKEDK